MHPLTHDDDSHDDDDADDDDRPINALDALYEDLAIDASENLDDLTEHERLQAEHLRQRVLQMLDRSRRARTSNPTSPAEQPDVRPQFVDTSRDQLLDSLEDLADEAGIRLVHSKLSHLSDNDLRRYLETLESQRRQP